MGEDRIDDALRDRVLAGLGIAALPAADLEGLRAVYAAWCRRVPFDNIAKMTALRAPGRPPLPGIRASDFFATWLATGAGGTCWPTSNALFALLRSLGFAARRVAGCMRDLGVVNHGSVRVEVGGGEWLADSSMLTEEPMPLGNAVHVRHDTVVPAEVELEAGAHVLWADMPPNTSWLPCRLGADEKDHAFYVAAYEDSREQSPFNQRLYARTNREGAMWVLAGGTKFVKTPAGTEARALTPDGVLRSLVEEFGYSESLVDTWVQNGGLASSFEPPSGPKPPPVTRRPPSRR